MTNNQAVKDYLNRRFGQEDGVLHAIRAQADAEGLPSIHVPIYMGKLLQLLAKIQGATQILEVGTLGGYSTAWLAKALPPGGRLISLEINSLYAYKAQESLKQIPDVMIEIRVGHAVGLLAQLVEAGEGPFDLIFIDADKENNVLYLDWCLSLSRAGTLILIDNLIPKGDCLGYAGHEEAKAVYAFNDYLVQHPLLETAALATLAGLEGRLDGLALVRVKENIKEIINVSRS
jgi:predicted O-methyltransferase YrrM